MISDGTVSDVNCTRRVSSPRTFAKAMAVVVLPTPGTSSMRTWPCARIAIKIFSTISFLPTITDSISCKISLIFVFINLLLSLFLSFMMFLTDLRRSLLRRHLHRLRHRRRYCLRQCLHRRHRRHRCHRHRQCLHLRPDRGQVSAACSSGLACRKPCRRPR